MNCIRDRPLAILFMFLLTQAVALTGYGLVPFVRGLFPGVAVTLFVLLSVPSSGGAVPIPMVPGFFRALHPVLPFGNLVDALRTHFYFSDSRLRRPVLVLSLWVLAGSVLICLGALVERRRIATMQKQTDELVSAADLEQAVEDPALQTPRTLPTAVTAHSRASTG